MAQQKQPHGTAGGPGLDSDLDDLLGDGANSPSKSIAQSAFASTSSTYTYADRHKSYYTSHGGLGFCGYLSACCWLTFQSSPKCGWILTLLVLIGMAYGLMYLLDPTAEVGVVEHDWTNVNSQYDLKAGDISHWCLAGDDSSCRCEDPLVPADRGEFKSWSKAHAANKRLINRYTDPYSPESDVDVAFLGESLVEEMDGRWLGMTQGEHLESLAKMFNKRFQKRYGAPLEAVPLGIAGDASPNVLWRMIHGEMPDAFNPKVWWISMGMNDLARMQCSEEVVIMGILRVVEEIRMKKPDAKIVINSLLPMTDVRSGAFPLQNDYKDAFRNSVNIPSRGIGRGRIFGPRPTVTVDSSHIARKPSKAIQGEKEDDDDAADKGRGNKFPKALRTRRLAGRKSTAKLTPEQKRQADLAEKRARMQELLKKRQAFMNKQLAQRLRKDAINPIMRDKTTYKRRDPKKLFVRQSETPLWPAINVINNNLRRFAEKHYHITYFDATDIFASRSGRGAWILKSNMISVRGHPTEDGFRAWEDAVAAKLKYMLKDKPKIGATGEQPGNVLPAGNPAIPEPKPVPQAPQPPPIAPKFPSKEQPDDEISESELSGDESQDDDKKASSDDAKKEGVEEEEDSEEEEEEEIGSDDEESEEDSGSEDGKADESESQDADNSAQSEEEEIDSEESGDEESADDEDASEDENESEEEEQENVDSSEEEEAAPAEKPASTTKKVASSSAAKAAAAKGSSVTKTTADGTTKTTFTKTTAATTSTAGKKSSGTSSTVTKTTPTVGKVDLVKKTTSTSAEKKPPTKTTSIKATSTKKTTSTKKVAPESESED